MNTNRSRAARLAAFCAALVLFGGGPATARTPTLAECAAIQSDSERLACYDRISGVRPVAAPEEPASAGGPDDIALPEPAGTAAPGAKPSLIDTAWAFAPDAPKFIISTYRPNYLLFAHYTNSVNNQPFTPLFEAADVSDQNLDAVEAMFQISFKTRLWTTDDRRWGAWIGYTQQSQWQVYNDDTSRPFRETNYMPEIFLSYRPDVTFGGFHWRLLNLGYNHQSNGRSQILSRSWDRLFAEFGIERGNFALLVTPWYRISESDDDDDNPDITDYLGYGNITAVYKPGNHSLALMLRGNFSTGKGAAQFTWQSPPLLGPLRAYLKAFTGYGESLIDYNWNQTSIGIGLALNDVL
ncbi:MAG: phospholipase A [Desulfobacterales bacterium]|nr:phospholipase A [Desulfobacterales bacterium]